MTNSELVKNPFSHLNIDNLKRHAQEWITLFQDVPITKITLFSKKANDRYIVVFDIDFIDKPIYGNKKPLDRPFSKLKSANPRSRLFINPEFKDAYVSEPQNNNFLKEWRFFVLARNSQKPPCIKYDEPSIILYNIKKPIEKRDAFSEQEKDRFGDLNLTMLADSAAEWYRKFYLLEKVILYKSERKGTEYVLAFMVNDDLFARQNFESNSEFRNWHDHSLYGDGILQELCKKYKDKKKSVEDIGDEWFTPIIQPGENLDIWIAPGTGIPLCWRSDRDIDAFENQNKPVIEELKKQSQNLLDSDWAEDETEKAVESTDSVNFLTPLRQDKKEARDIAEKYINECKNTIPSIKDAVIIVKDKYTRNMYKDKTIHNWIKDIFPPESRKPGRRPKTIE